MARRVQQQPMPGWGDEPPVRGPRPSGKKIAKIGCGGVAGLLVAAWILGTIVGPPKKTAALAKPAPSTTASTAAPTTAAPSTAPPPAATAAAPTPTPPPATVSIKAAAPTTPPAAPPTSAAPSPPQAPGPTCSPTRDVLVRYITPDLPPSAQTLGNYDLQNCETTFESLQGDSPMDAGFCTQAAWADDNPGYDADATPARPLKKIQVEYGPAC